MVKLKIYKQVWAALAIFIVQAGWAGEKPKIALVFDDWGNLPVEHSVVQGFGSVDCVFAAAVIPGLVHSTETADYFYRLGQEIIIHIPMESENEAASEEIELTVSMDEEDMRGVIYQAIYDIPHASGMSNHQGSRFTSDKAALEKFAKVLRDTTLYFLDSVTIPKSQAFKICRKYGAPVIKRDVFLDTYFERGESADDRFHQLVETAKKQGYAVGIGHRYPETLEALQKFLVSPERDEVEIVFPSELVDYK